MNSRTCLPCRSRKVKCDGGIPRCAKCSRSRLFLDCSYECPKSLRVILSKKEACLPCRKKKRKCDALRPTCSRCHHANADADCVYDLDLTFPDDVSREGGGVTMYGTTKQITVPVAGQDGMALSTSDILLKLRLQDAIYPGFPVGGPGSFTPYHTIQIPPHLEDFGHPLKSALSDVSLDDLNMKFRILFITYRLAYGFYFPTAKLQALILGDTSSKILLPFFLHLSHLVGAHFYQERLGRYCLHHIQARHLQATLDALHCMKEEDDPLALSQAFWCMCMIHACAQSHKLAKIYLRKSLEIIRRHDIQFVPTSRGDAASQERNVCSPLPPFSETLHERAAFLGQMLYGEVFVYISSQPGPRTHIGPFDEDFNNNELPFIYSDVYLPPDPSQWEHTSPGLEAQFRYELPDAYPILFEICPIMLRVRTILLAKDGDNIISWFNQQTTPSASWFSTAQIFTSILVTHLDNLTSKLAESMDRKDAESCLALRYSVIISLTAIAQIYDTFARNSSSEAPTKPLFRKKCADALKGVLLIVNELKPMEFRYLDVFLTIYWTRALSHFNRIQRPPVETDLEGYVSSYSTGMICFTPPDLPSATEDFDLDGMISRVAQLNEEFVKHRFLPGTTSLCADFAAQGLRTASKDTA